MASATSSSSQRGVEVAPQTPTVSPSRNQLGERSSEEEMRCVRIDTCAQIEKYLSVGTRSARYKDDDIMPLAKASSSLCRDATCRQMVSWIFSSAPAIRSNSERIAEYSSGLWSSARRSPTVARCDPAGRQGLLQHLFILDHYGIAADLSQQAEDFRMTDLPKMMTCPPTSFMRM